MKPGKRWEAAPESVKAAFAAALPDDPSVERRVMFGYPCAFTEGKMFTGVFAASVIVRLPEARRGEVTKPPSAVPFEPWPGRAMKEYIQLSGAMIASKAKLKALIREALEYTRSLPAKKRPPRRKSERKVRNA